MDPIAPYSYQISKTTVQCVSDCSMVDGANLVNGVDYTCECADGYIWDDKEFACLPCSAITPMCSSCLPNGTCTECKSQYLILNPDQDECWNKMPNCIIPLVNQTWDYFNDGEGDDLLDSNGYYFCPQCNTGYFWQIDEEGGQGQCAKCSAASHEMRMCEECVGEDKCTSCRNPYVLLPGGKGCLKPIDNCYVDPSDYVLERKHHKETLICP